MSFRGKGSMSVRSVPLTVATLSVLITLIGVTLG